MQKREKLQDIKALPVYCGKQLSDEIGRGERRKAEYACVLSCAALTAPVCQVPFSQEPGEPLAL